MLPLRDVACIVMAAVCLMPACKKVVSQQPWTVRDEQTEWTVDEMVKTVPFVFIWGQGSGSDGFDTLRVDDSNRVTYAFRSHNNSPPSFGVVWRRVEFDVDQEVVVRLRELLWQHRMDRLEKAYHSGIQDGPQWFLLVSAGGKQKSIYCDNWKPAEVDHVAGFVQQHVLQPHQKIIDAATAVTFEEAQAESVRFFADRRVR